LRLLREREAEEPLEFMGLRDSSREIAKLPLQLSANRPRTDLQRNCLSERVMYSTGREYLFQDSQVGSDNRKPRSSRVHSRGLGF